MLSHQQCTNGTSDNVKQQFCKRGFPQGSGRRSYFSSSDFGVAINDNMKWKSDNFPAPILSLTSGKILHTISCDTADEMDQAKLHPTQKHITNIYT